MKSISDVSWKPKKFLIVILFAQFMLCVTVLLDIPIVRQVIGFLYYTFVPGFILVKLFKIDTISKTEKLLLSVGFSIAFLIIGGFLINEFCFLFGVLRPLSLAVLFIASNGFIIIISMILVFLRGVEEICNGGFLHFSPHALLLLCLPILSIAGITLVNMERGNMLLLIMIVVIAIIFLNATIFRNLLPSRLYPFAILMIAIALLFHTSIVSNYIFSFGSDAPIEYFVFKNTKDNMRWDLTFSYRWNLQFGRMYDMLSITILPTFYSNVLNISSECMFKIVYPLLFSLVPLCLYQIWRKYVGNRYAFISAFLFMAYEIFYTEMLGLNRQIIGEFFLALLLFVILDEKMKQSIKTFGFVIFSFGLITSHYGLSLIFMFFISFYVFVLFIAKKSSRNITASMAIIFSVLMFGWYVFTCKSSTFDSILAFGDRVRSELGDFFNPESRGQVVMRGLGLERPPTFLNAISRIFAYATEALIVLGFVGLLAKKVKNNFKREFFFFISEAIVLLILLIVLPGMAETMNMTRFYHVLLFFLAPLCVLGAEFVSKLIIKRKHEVATLVLMVCVLVPYFFFQTHFLFEVTGGNSLSVPLSGYRMDVLQLYALGYIDTYSMHGAQWISKNVDFIGLRLYSDGYSREYVLTIYGAVYPDYIDELSNVTIIKDKGVVYLSTINVIGDVIPFGRFSWNTSELSSVFDDLNIIYTNGGSGIYKHSP